MWKKIKKIDNKAYSTEKIVIEKDGVFIPEPQEVTTILGSHFASISSNENYSNEFLIHKNQVENNHIFFEEANHTKYNQPFTIHEFNTALNPTANSSPGEDRIPYELYKKMPSLEKNKLLELFNHI